jgi:hypothetical protein
MHENREQLILEPFFNLAYYFGMDWVTFYNFPITYRRWLMKRLNEEFEKASKNKEPPPSKAAHHNSPDIRALTGKVRPQVPHKLRGKPMV